MSGINLSAAGVTPAAPDQFSAVTLAGEWRFDSSLIMADPGSGDLRLNNAALAAATQMAISDITDSGVDGGNLLSQLDVGDRIYVQEKDDSANFAVYNITAPATDNATWHQLAIAVQASGGSLSNNDRLIVILQFGANAQAAGQLYTTVVGTTAELVAALESDLGDTFIKAGFYTIDTDTVGPLDTTPRHFVGAGRQGQGTGPFSGPGVIIEFVGAGGSISGLDFSAGLTESEGVEWENVSMFSSTAALVSFLSGCYSLKNINLNGGSVSTIGFADSANIVNCSVVNMGSPGIGFFGCINVANCTAGGTTAGDLTTIGFFICENLVNCRWIAEAGASGADIPFGNCLRLSNCEADASLVTSVATLTAFDTCEGLANCRALGPSVGAIAGTKGFDTCTGLTNVEAFRFGANFDLCTFITNGESTQGVGGGTDGTHFTASTGLVNCKANGAGDDVGINGFFGCLGLTNCEALSNTDHGFSVCEDLNNCRATDATNNGFDNSSNLTTCTSILNGANGFSRCARISTSRAVGNAGDGFNFSSFLSGCQSNTSTLFGYAAACLQISNCAGAGNTAGLSDLSNLIADPVTAAGI